MKKVSILIAARNEAANIVECLQSVEALSYPKSYLQVLVGDDASTDDTADLIRDFIKDKPYFELVSIGTSLPNLKGKTNVLAQLAHKATGEYLFFTDADIEVPTDWIQEMLRHFKPKVGVVTGITTMKIPKFPRWGLAGFQGLEWLYYLSIMRLFSLLRVPVTAMGNNMAVTRQAYDAIGGYEGIPFSITEDYALFRAILDVGFRFEQLYDRRVLTISKPVPTFQELLIQRKRWMYGAMSLPWELRIGVYLNGLLLPIFGILACVFPQFTLLLVVLSYLFTTAWLIGGLSWLQLNALLLGAPFFWFYHLGMNFTMLINFYTATSTKWKGRTYS